MGNTSPDAADTIARVWIIGEGAAAFDFDSVISEGHTSRLAIMENPVETGVIVADHAFLMPKELEINAVVSNVWLGMRAGQHGKDIEPLNKDKDWLIPADGSDSSSRCQRAFELMLGLQESANPFSVQTGLLLYENMLITELTANQDKRTSSALVFRAVLREVLIVSTQTVTYPPRADKPTTRAASQKVTAGQQQAVAPPAEKRTSLALQGARAVGKLLK